MKTKRTKILPTVKRIMNVLDTMKPLLQIVLFILHTFY